MSKSGASNTILDAQNQNDSVILRMYHEDNNDRGDGMIQLFQLLVLLLHEQICLQFRLSIEMRNNQLFPMRPKFRNCIFRRIDENRMMVAQFT